MEGFSSPPRRGLLLFEGEGSANLAELDLKPHFTPMIWCFKNSGFQVKEKEEEEEDKGKREK